jgi:hypothetical protein
MEERSTCGAGRIRRRATPSRTSEVFTCVPATDSGPTSSFRPSRGQLEIGDSPRSFGFVVTPRFVEIQEIRRGEDRADDGTHGFLERGAGGKVVPGKFHTANFTNRSSVSGSAGRRNPGRSSFASRDRSSSASAFSSGFFVGFFGIPVTSNTSIPKRKLFDCWFFPVHRIVSRWAPDLISTGMWPLIRFDSISIFYAIFRK